MEPTPAALTEIALDLRWSWNHSADELWRRLEPDLWDDTRNAWVVLQTVSRKRLDEAFADPAFLAELNNVLREREESARRVRWFGEERKSRADRGGLFQPRVHVERGFADLFGRPGKCGGRSAQGGGRSGCAGDRDRASLQPGIFPAIHRCGRPAICPAAGERYGPIADFATAQRGG